MIVTIDISLYPLSDDFVPHIKAFIATLRAHDGLTLVVNQMSTQARGELDVVMAALHAAIATSFAGGLKASVVTKILNSDLDIAAAPSV